MIGKCTNCEKEDEIHAKGLCYRCYRKISWKSPKIICKRCGREKHHHAKGLCPGCYNSIFHIDKVKEQNAIRRHKINIFSYREKTEKCLICGFDQIVDLHHLDRNIENNSDDNLAGLCPNHHKMIHDRRFRKEIFQILKKEGFKIPEVYKDDEFFK